MQPDGALDGDPRVAAVLAHLSGSSVPFSLGNRGDLAGLALGRAALIRQIDPHATPPWWMQGAGGLNLAQADLADARLEETDLSGANLRQASLAGALARSAGFEGACLEEADFAGADLSGARFAGVAGGQASFREAMLEDADFSGSTRRSSTAPASRGPTCGAPISRGRMPTIPSSAKPGSTKPTSPIAT